MQTQAQIKLVDSPFGRMLLHLLCLLRGGKAQWHMGGMKREMNSLRWRLSRRAARIAPPALIQRRIESVLKT